MQTAFCLHYCCVHWHILVETHTSLISDINVLCAVGGVTNILTTEMFTQTDRPAAYMISGTINWTSFFLIGMIFPFIVVYTNVFFPLFLEKCILMSGAGLHKHLVLHCLLCTEWVIQNFYY